MANRRFTQFYGSLHKKPVQLDCNFVVDPTNGNGLGIRELKGPGIANVFMHTVPAPTTTTAFFPAGVNTVLAGNLNALQVGMLVADTTTPGNISAGTSIIAINPANNQVTLSSLTVAASAASPGDTLSFTVTQAVTGNPNPAPGLAVVEFQDNYNRYFFGTAGFVSPLSGTPILLAAGTLVVGNTYVIVTVGTSTPANWNAVGVPMGTTPQPGVSFIASATTGFGTGAVESPSVSGISSVEVVGDPNTTLESLAATVLGVGSGAYMVLQFLGPTSAGVTTPIPTAPAVGTGVGLSFFLSNSIIMQQGE